VNLATLPQRYLDRVNLGDPGPLSELFAVDALFCGPLGQVLRGRDAIRDFYAGVFAHGIPEMAVGRTLMDGNRLAFELINRQLPANPDDPAQAIDLIEVDDRGLISSFAVFLRPRAADGAGGETLFPR
jgi:uncharacterized protein (TIGR02246 family)